MDTVDREAYDLFLRGSEEAMNITQQGLSQADRFLQRVTQLDPNF
ncbi:MAG: hypothetical protein VCD00_16090 [Candidatus Hydrogenedentota bacterium]